MRYRVTRAGLLFTFATFAVAFAAVVSANNLLFLILAAMMATILISGLVSRLCLAGLELDFQFPDHIPARRTVPARLRVTNHKWLMPSFSIRVEPLRASGMEVGIYFPLLPGGATIEETVKVRFPARGAYRENGFAFSTTFPFGFLEKIARVTLSREVVVYPPVDPQLWLRRDLLSDVSRRNRRAITAVSATISLPHSPPTRPSKARATWIGRPPRTLARLPRIRRVSAPRRGADRGTLSWIATCASPIWTPGLSTPSPAAPSRPGGFPRREWRFISALTLLSSANRRRATYILSSSIWPSSIR